MSDLQELVHRSVTPPELTADELGRIKHRAAKANRQRRLAVAVAVGILIVVAGMGIRQLVRSPHAERIVATPSPSPSTGRAHGPALSARLVLPSRTFAAGSTVGAVVEVTNPTGKTINAIGCGGIFATVLSNSSYSQEPATLSCAQTYPITPGRFTFQVPVRTNYSQCAPITPGVQCLPNSSPPALPVGSYKLTLVFVGDHANIELPDPITVNIGDPSITPLCPRGYTPGINQLVGRCLLSGNKDLDGLRIDFVSATPAPGQFVSAGVLRVEVSISNTTDTPRRVPDFGIICESSTAENGLLAPSDLTGSMLAAHTKRTARFSIFYPKPCDFPTLVATALNGTEWPHSLAWDLHASVSGK
jgi:hypothetical protein